MTPILVPRDRWYTEKGISFPADMDAPNAVSDLSVTAWSGYPPTTADLSWTVPADLPSGDPATFEVRGATATDGNRVEWPTWDHAQILAPNQAYSGGEGTTQTITVTIWDPKPKNSWLFCVRSLDADNNISTDSNIAIKLDDGVGAHFPLLVGHGG